MKKKPWGKLAAIVLALGVVVMIIMGLLPKPVIVETTQVARTDMRVTLEAEGRTRIRDRYLISASVTGRLDRVMLREGDPVGRGAAVCRLYPPVLDPIQRDQSEGRIAAAQAGHRQAQSLADGARQRLVQAERERDRLRQLEPVGAIPEQDLERAATAVELARRELQVHDSRSDAAAEELAAARLARSTYPDRNADAQRAIVLRAPADGRVLQLLDKGERLVPAGTPIMQIGDPAGLEFMVDLLSSDAVNIEPGGMIEIDGWGGDEVLRARVKYVEPSAFTRVSALGVEEQRVNVIAELIAPNHRLGDGYRANARFILWEGKNVLTIPTSALFRHNGSWSVFAIRDGHATRTDVQIGHMNAFTAELLGGVDQGAEVVVHPSDRVEEGGEVKVVRVSREGSGGTE